MIRAVLFDFGGVLATEGFHDGLHAVALGQGLDPQRVFQIAREAVYESGYVTGQGNEGDFWGLVRLRAGVRGSDAELSAACLDRFRLRPGMVELARGLRARGIVTAILSDQTDWLEQLDARTPFFRDFDRVFNSFRLGKGKRDPTLFVDAARDLGVAPAEAVFVDDDPGNVSRAAARGMQALHFRDEPSLRRALGALVGVDLEERMKKLRIAEYSFGRIVVDGTAYADDVVVYPDRVEPSWRRRDGHRLAAADLRQIVVARPELLVLGTGARGVMQVPDETLAFLREQGIETHAAWTGKAVQIFNALTAASPEKRVVGGFHVTC